MKQKDVFKKIGGIIQELSDQYEYLKTVNDDLNDLELELFAANAHFLTDHIEILCKLNLQKESEKKQPENKRESNLQSQEKPGKPAKPEKKESTYEQKFFEPVVQQMKGHEQETKEQELFKPVEFKLTPTGEEEQEIPSIDLSTAAPSDEYSYTRQEPEMKWDEPDTIRHELIIDESMDLDEDEKQESDEIEIPEPSMETGRAGRRKRQGTIAEPEAAADEPLMPAEHDTAPTEEQAAPADDEVFTINDKMSQLADKGMSRTEQIGIKPISDIKLAITLNDKLLYVKDLFNGYNLAYSEAIEILNRFTTFEEASRFLKTNYVTKNNWDGKPATVEKFYALLKRRYA